MYAICFANHSPRFSPVVFPRPDHSACCGGRRALLCNWSAVPFKHSFGFRGQAISKGFPAWFFSRGKKGVLKMKATPGKLQCTVHWGWMWLVFIACPQIWFEWNKIRCRAMKGWVRIFLKFRQEGQKKPEKKVKKVPLKSYLISFIFCFFSWITQVH